MQGTRFRHAAKFLRWRPDKRPQDCRYDQLEVTPAYELDRVFGARDPLSQPCAARGPGIIVRFGRIFWRALALGNVAQIDPDASPLGRSAAHRVDEDIVHVQPRRRFRIPGLPAFEAGERVRFTRRLGDGDEWLVDSRWPRRSFLGPEAFRRDGATRSGSSRCFL
jgi:hypothetical protein